jgi:hypothetical protein
MPSSGQRTGGKRKSRGHQNEANNSQVTKGAETPRDLHSEDSGVPRGDWNDDPLQQDDGAEGIRSNFDDHYPNKGRKGANTKPDRKS